jgi:hypothetical protein
MEKNQIMKAITAKIGQSQAIDTVMQAYNTELITTWLSHLEPNKPGLGRGKPRDHLTDALKRVQEVCDLI